MASPTLGGALAALVRNGSRFNTGQVFWLELAGDEVRLHRSYTRALSRGRAPAGEYALLLSLQLFRLAAGPRWRPSEIWFEGEPPAYAERLAALAEHGVRFGSSPTTVVFPARMLALPLRTASRTEPVRASAPLPSTDPLTSLRQAIEALVRRGRGDVREAAEVTGQSVRSFQRSLRTAGLRFADLLEQQRFLAARRLLADRDRKLIEVAVALGYTDSANFTRAFRRWAGLSPQAFRRAAGGATATP